jgi:hypothetical protein
MGDEPRASEDQVEDLEMKEEDAEDVKGGYSFGATQTGSFAKGDGSVRPGKIRGTDGVEQQHNETLVRI